MRDDEYYICQESQLLTLNWSTQYNLGNNISYASLEIKKVQVHVFKAAKDNNDKLDFVGNFATCSKEDDSSAIMKGLYLNY